MKTIFLLGILSFNNFANAETYQFATGEWAPYTGEKIANYGLASEIVLESMKAVGDEVKFLFYPWARCTDAVLNDSSIVGTFPWSKTEERSKKFDYSDLFLKSDEKLFFIKGLNKNIEWNQPQDLKSFSFAGTRSYAHVEFLEKAGAKVDVADSDELNFKKLLAGRIQYFPVSEAVGWDLIKTKFAADKDKFATVTKPILSDSLAIMVKKDDAKSKAFLEKFNKGLKIIKENGKFSEISKKYGLE